MYSSYMFQVWMIRTELQLKSITQIILEIYNND